MATLESGLQTIDLGTQGWNAIFSSDMRILDEHVLSSSHVRGLELEWVSASSVRVRPGACADADHAGVVFLESEAAVSLPENLDSGTELANTWYFVWIAKNPASGAVACFFSASQDSPSAPPGHSLRRRIGSVRNDATQKILKFAQFGAGNARINRYLADISETRVLAGGTAANFSPVDCSAFVPPVSRTAHLRLANEGTAPWLASQDGANVSDRIYERNSQQALWLFPGSGARTMHYKRESAGASAYIEVAGWMESI